MILTFVCSGNTCRSPLAVAAWQVAMREMDEPCRARLACIEVRSAGLNAARGHARHGDGTVGGGELERRFKRTSVARLAPAPANADGAQSIATMTAEQTAQVRFRLQTQNANEQEAPAVETLGAFVTNSARAVAPSWSEASDELALDIPDPYGGSSEAYEECGDRILRAVRALARSFCRE